MRMAGRGPAAVLALILLVSSIPPVAPQPDSGPPPAVQCAPPRAVERPDHTGPHPSTGFMYASFQSSAKSYANNLKVFYPALTAAENASTDASGAPYPVVLQLPPFGGNVEGYNSVAPLVASWGFVSVVIEPNWTDIQATGMANPNSTDMEELLDMLEGWNNTTTHKLSGMLQRNFGISGYSSGGGIAVIDGALVPRIRALQAMAPAIGDSTLDALAPGFNKPFQFQAGQNDSQYRPHSVHGYNVFPPPKSFLDTKDGGHGGPFYWDCMVAFFIRYLKNDTGYDTFLYGWGAMDDLSTVKYYLHFRLPDGTFFPPGIQAQGIPNIVNISESVGFNGIRDGYVPLGHPNGTWRWDFQDDGTVDHSSALDPNTTYAYDRSGQMAVKLWYSIGEYRIDCNNSLAITVRNQPPTVSLKESYSAAEDGTLQFTADATDTPVDNASLQFTWEFGDGRRQGPGPDRTVLHKYTRAGNFTLRVTVRDPPGDSVSATARVSIADIPPTVQVAPDISADKDSPVRFTGTGGGTASDLLTLNYSWSFGDGGSSAWSSDPNATHTYTRGGNFTAVLSAKDDEGTVVNASLKVGVFNQLPSVRILAPVPGATFDKDREVQFSGSGTDTASDTPVLVFRWDFGDGNLSEWSPSPDAAHTYTRGGALTARLMARDSEGAIGDASAGVTVRNQAPKVTILSPWATEAEEDSPVKFSAEGTDTASDEDLLNYTWLIDGETRYGASFDLSFTTEGVKQVAVTVRDPEGVTASATRTITINNREPRVNPTVAPLRLTAGTGVQYSATVSDSPSDKASLRISWSFGDGATSSNFSGVHNYTAAGTYDVQVTVTDDEDASDSQSFKVTVDPAPVEPVKPPQNNGTGGSGGLSTRTLAIMAAAGVGIPVIAIALFLVMRRKRPPPVAAAPYVPPDEHRDAAALFPAHNWGQQLQPGPTEEAVVPPPEQWPAPPGHGFSPPPELQQTPPPPAPDASGPAERPGPPPAPDIPAPAGQVQAPPVPAPEAITTPPQEPPPLPPTRQ